MLRVCSLGLLIVLILPESLAGPTIRKHSAETAPPAGWRKRLDKHLALAKQVLAQVAAEDDDFHPIAAYVMPDGQEDLAILVFSPEAKQRAIAKVTRQARERRCRGLILVGDAWTAPPIPGRAPRAGDAANHPRREECLVLFLFTPNGAWCREVRYRRKGKKIRFHSPGAWFPPNSPWDPWEQVR